MNTTATRRSPALSLIRLILIVLAAQAPALFLIWDQGRDIKDQGDKVQAVTEDTNRVVGYIDDQTNPERQAEQQAALDGILVRIDCNDAYRLQLVVDGLVDQGVIQPIDVQANCGGDR